VPDKSITSFFSSTRFRYGLGLLFFLIVAGFFLWEEHEAHILGNLPLFLILGACVGMHFLMHGSHVHGKTDNDEYKGPPKVDKE